MRARAFVLCVFVHGHVDSLTSPTSPTTNSCHIRWPWMLLSLSLSLFQILAAASIVSDLLHGGRNRANTYHSITAYIIYWVLAPAQLQCCPGVYTLYMGT